MRSSRRECSQRREAAWGLYRGPSDISGSGTKSIRREKNGGNGQGGWREIRREQCPKSQLRDVTPFERYHKVAEEGKNQDWTNNVNLTDDLDLTGFSRVEGHTLDYRGLEREREEGSGACGDIDFVGFAISRIKNKAVARGEGG